jgi:uncharacterized repeat protein (TIGR03833 family)
MALPTEQACHRSNISLGMEVDIVTKRDQRYMRLTRGKVRSILTSKPYHSRGIKVMLESRVVGRVQRIAEDGSEQITDQRTEHGS